jgi:hypothetical protein
MTIQIGSLLIKLGLDSGAFKSGLSVSERELKASTKRIRAIGNDLQGFGAKLSVGVTVPLIALAKKSVDGFVDQQKAMADVNAALASMGQASGKTSAELAKTADALELRSLFDADVILKQVTANLLTFGNVAGEQFDRAQQAAVDMATRLGTEPQSAAITLGKALNSPIKGITALTRVGVDFTDKQKAQIKAMTEAGNVAGAQGIILAEVERQFRGAAAAAADASPWRKAQVAIGQAMDAIGAAILPIIKPASEAIASIARAFAELPGGVQKAIVIVGTFGAALGPLLIPLGAAIKTMAPFLAAVSSIGKAQGGLVAFRAGIIGITSAFAPLLIAVGAGYLAWKNWDKIAPALAGIGRGLGLLEGRVSSATGKLEDAFGGIATAATASGVATQQEIDKINAGLAQIRETGRVNPETTKSITELIYKMQQAGTVAPEEAEKVRKALLNVWTEQDAAKQKGSLERTAEGFSSLARAIVSNLDELDRTSDEAWMSAWRSFDTWWTNVKAGATDIGARLAKLAAEVRTYLVDKLNAVWSWVVEKIGSVKMAFFDLYDAVVGNSYVPDMVDGIAREMGRLDSVMVDKAQLVTKKTGEAFRELARDVRSILDRLFPEAATQRQFLDETITLNKALKAGAIEADAYEAAIGRLNRERAGLDLSGPKVAVSAGLLGTGPLFSSDDLRTSIEETARAIDLASNRAALATVKIAKSFKDMAQDTISSLTNVVNAIKGGGFLNVLSSVVNLVLQLGSIGLFGKGIQTNINKPIPSYAGGTSFHSGGLALVGERGPELVGLGRGASVLPARATAAALHGRTVVEIVDTTGLFVTRVNGQIMQAAPAIAEAGARGGVSRVAYRNSRRVG